MIRLLTVCLVSAAIRTKVAGSFQTGPSGGESSPLYNLLASSLLSKYPQLNTSAEPAPLTCTCGFCDQRPPIPPPQDLPQPPTMLSGVVMFPTSELQQVLRAPVPVPLYGPSPHPPPSQQPYTPPSYIMTIPKKYPSQVPPPNPIQETYPAPSRNFKYSLPPPPPNPTPPRPYNFNPKPPAFASCPATVFFPPPTQSFQSLSFNQPTFYSSPPPQKSPPSSFHPSPTYPPPPPPKYQMAAPPPPPPPPPYPPPAPPSPPREPLLTYTLRAPATQDLLPGTSLEAEGSDCSVPTPPSLV